MKISARVVQGGGGAVRSRIERIVERIRATRRPPRRDHPAPVADEAADAASGTGTNEVTHG